VGKERKGRNMKKYELTENFKVTSNGTKVYQIKFLLDGSEFKVLRCQKEASFGYVTRIKKSI
jgi:hypothetical protein